MNVTLISHSFLRLDREFSELSDQESYSTGPGGPGEPGKPVLPASPFAPLMPLSNCNSYWLLVYVALQFKLSYH